MKMFLKIYIFKFKSDCLQHVSPESHFDSFNKYEDFVKKISLMGI